MLSVGDAVPDFTAWTTDGEVVTLSALRGGCVVLYFYPGAFTPGGTHESLRFRDSSADIGALGARVFGVSVDDPEIGCGLTGSTFPMICDADGAVARLFGVVRPFRKLDKRVTFVIDPDGLVAGVFEHEFQLSRHLDGVLHLLERMGRPESMGPAS